MTDDTPSSAPVGRPPKFSSVEELQDLINAYFSDCDADGTPYTVTGLALALDTTRKTLCDYEKILEFSDTIKIAKTRVENYAEQKLFGKNPTGPIFALKNFGWSDKQEHELFGPGGEPLNSIPALAVLAPETLNELLRISTQLDEAAVADAESGADEASPEPGDDPA